MDSPIISARDDETCLAARSRSQSWGHGSGMGAGAHCTDGETEWGREPVPRKARWSREGGVLTPSPAQQPGEGEDISAGKAPRGVACPLSGPCHQRQSYTV